MATFVSISGDALNALKDVHRRNLSVPERLASQECVACTKAIADDRWQTEPGRRELERTGVCERCWDTIHVGHSGSAAVRSSEHQWRGDVQAVDHVQQSSRSRAHVFRRARTTCVGTHLGPQAAATCDVMSRRRSRRLALRPATRATCQHGCWHRRTRLALRPACLRARGAEGPE